MKCSYTAFIPVVPPWLNSQRLKWQYTTNIPVNCTSRSIGMTWFFVYININADYTTWYLDIINDWYNCEMMPLRWWDFLTVTILWLNILCVFVPQAKVKRIRFRQYEIFCLFIPIANIFSILKRLFLLLPFWSWVYQDSGYRTTPHT